MKCRFCEKEVTTRSGVHVCNNCHTVHCSKNISLENMHSQILKYLCDIQSRVSEQRGFLHDIEQKHILGHTLTPDEEEIRKNMVEFQDIRLELNTLIANGSHLIYETDRQLLYRLLTLSEWFSKYFEEKV